jgi:hypothetical protein
MLRSGRTEGSFSLHSFQTSTPCRMRSRCSGLATALRRRCGGNRLLKRELRERVNDLNTDRKS